MMIISRNVKRAVGAIPLGIFIILPVYYVAYTSQKIADLFDLMDRGLAKKFIGRPFW